MQSHQLRPNLEQLVSFVEDTYRICLIATAPLPLSAAGGTSCILEAITEPSLLEEKIP
ncbi:unnamed protein product, partial [Linum tenue]